MGEELEREGWISIFESGTDYEADLVRDRLDAEGLPAVVFTRRDHVFPVNIGDLARVHVMVPLEHADDARAILATPPVSGKELTEAALNADPNAPDAHDPDEEALLDSGADKPLRFSPPGDDD